MAKGSTSPVKRFIKALRKLDPKWPIKESDGEYYSRCPVHNGDDDDSMSFKEGSDGRLIVHCHSQGCSYQDVMAEVGLEQWHGFRKGTPGNRKPKSIARGNRRQPGAATSSASRGDVSSKEKASANSLAKGAPKFYEYTAEDGDVVGRVVKTPLLDPQGQQVKKTIYQQRRVKDGFSNKLKAGWFKPLGANLYEWEAGPNDSKPSPGAILESEPARFPIYRLPEILEEVKTGETIFVVEGEKDVDAAREIGLCATTNPGGAGKWRKDHSESLQGASLVVIIPDNDKAGLKHVEAVTKQLVGQVEEVRIVELPGLGEGGDFSDWIAAGGSVDDLCELVQSTDPWSPEQEEQYELLDDVPLALHHPVSVIGETGYLVTEAHMQKGSGDPVRSRIVVSDSLDVFSNYTFNGSMPMEKLPILDKVPDGLPPHRVLSQPGMKRLLAGDRPIPVEVFLSVERAAHHFIDFGHRRDDDQVIGEIIALYVMSTYFIDAFSSVGYLWIYGTVGSGKTKLACFCVELSMLGELLLGSSSFASVRDIAETGAAIGFDDVNSLSGRDADPKLREFILSSYRKGSTISLKEKTGRTGNWETRRVRCFGPRMFSATTQPIAALASRSIFITLTPSPDPAKNARDPMSADDWPFDRRQLVDDLWLVGLQNVVSIRRYYRETQSDVLVGRAFEPWKPLLAIAEWLEGSGRSEVEGLNQRVHDFAVAYQDRKHEVERDRTRELLLAAIWKVLREAWSSADEASEIDDESLSFSYLVRPKEVEEKLTKIACREGVHRDEDEPFLDVREIGNRFGQFTFTKATRQKDGVRWKISPEDVLRLADGIGLTLEDDPRREQHGPEPRESVVECSECSECSSEEGDGEHGSRFPYDLIAPPVDCADAATPEIEGIGHPSLQDDYTNYTTTPILQVDTSDEDTLGISKQLPSHVTDFLRLSGGTDRSEMMQEAFVRLNDEPVEE